MRILIGNKTYSSFDPIIREAEVVPRIGDRIDMFYQPSPTVVDVIWWPKDEELKRQNIDVLVVVE